MTTSLSRSLPMRCSRRCQPSTPSGGKRAAPTPTMPLRLAMPSRWGSRASRAEAETWDHVCRAFQKRHLFAHKGGVVYEHYLSATRDPVATLGRRVPLSADEVM